MHFDDQAWAAASHSILNAHFTDPAITTAMWDLMEATGFDGGRVLEPGCGSGLFIGTAPDEIRDRADFVGVELEPITARVAELLYPEAEIRNVGFEKVRDVDGSYDAAIGNVPFGKYSLFDPLSNPDRMTIHNHFLAKSLTLTKPGGVVAMVTSRYTLDSRNPAPRRALQEHGDLLAAIRLPSGAHHHVAGTEAVTDVLVFRRRGATDVAAPFDWESTTILDTDAEPVRANSLFAPGGRGVVIGSITTGRGMYADDELLVTKPDDWHQQLEATVAALSPDLAGVYVAAPPTPQRPAPPVIDGREMRLNDLFLSETGALVEYSNDGPVAVKMKNKAVGRQVVALVSMRDTARRVIDLQSQGQTPGAVLAWDDARAELHSLYDAYVRHHGPINATEKSRAGNELSVIPPRFRKDAGWPLVAALEVYDRSTGIAKKADVFDQWLVVPERTHVGAESLPEALAASIARDRSVDVEFIANQLASEADTVQVELLDAGLVYVDPEAPDTLVPSEMYLSGSVRTKLAHARAAADTDPMFVANVDALVEVVPEWLSAEVITARLGSVWLDPSDIEDFLVETLGADPERTKVEHAPLVGKWTVDHSWSDERSVAATTEWGTDRAHAFDLVSNALNLEPTIVWKTIDERRVKDQEATLEANDKLQDLEDRFEEWVWEDPDRAARLEAVFNERFNSTVLTKWDGSLMGDLPGLTPSFTPHRHQRDAVWRIMNTDGSTLLPHKVGSGKTAAMVMAGVQLKRTGQISKPMYVVKNHMLEQFANEFRQLYPQAKVLVASKDAMSAEKRQTFVARCATGDWDGVVMTQSMFKKLPASIETQTDFVRDALTIYDTAEHAARAAGNTKAAKAIERSKAQLNTQLSELLSTDADVDNVTFEQCGVDYLMIDESHAYKSLKYPTSIKGVAGKSSKMATDLLSKMDWLRGQYGPKIATFASGTPITNSLAEMWVLKRMLVPELLADMNMQSFDSWAGTFARSVTKMELAPEGGRFRINTRLASFDNVPELLTLFHSFADFLDADALAGIKVPDVANGGPEIVLVPPTTQLDQLIESLGERADKIRGSSQSKENMREDNMLMVCSDGRLGSLDLRLLGRPQPAGSGKIDHVADKVAALYEQYRDTVYLDSSGSASSKRGALQVVFSDAGTPSKDRDFDVYNELRGLLAQRGMDPNRVQFIHDYGTDAAKERLFAACRDGDVDVIVGSTEKVGVGTNFQNRLVALHHVDAPWRPSDIEQREGRGIRQGNQNEQIHSIRYVTESSFDPYMYQTLERKARFVSQVTSSAEIDPTVRSIDDLDSDLVLSYAELKAISTGNPLIQEHAETVAAHARVARLAANHAKTQRSLPARIASLERQIVSTAGRVEALTGVAEQLVGTRGTDFRYTTPTGKVHDSRPDAGMSLRETLRALRGTEQWAPIGRLGGHEFHGRFRPFGEFTSFEFGVPDVMDNIRGSTVSYSARELFDAAPHSIMVRAERHLERVAVEVSDLRVHSENLVEQVARARDLHGHQFPHTAEVERLANRIVDLEKEMSGLEHDADNGMDPDDPAPPVAPSSPSPTPDDPGGATPATGAPIDPFAGRPTIEPDRGGGIEF